MPFFSAAPAMMGVESRKEKRAAVSRFILRKRPAVMVTPERETPGITASACATPTRNESRSPRGRGRARAFPASLPPT